MEKFIQELKELGLYLKVTGKDLILTGEDGKLTVSEIKKINQYAEITSFIRENKEELVLFVKKNNFKLDRENVSSICELSPVQEGVLFHSLYLSNIDQVDYSTNHTQNTVEFSSKVDVSVFRKVWAKVIQNHSILRTGFIADRVKIPLQFVYKDTDVPFTFLDYSDLSDQEADLKFEAYRKEDVKKQFVFTAPPLMRVTLVKFNESKYKMIWTRHHILLDGWSNQILIKEILALYANYYFDEEPLVIKEDNFQDHIKYLKTIDSYKEKSFWNTYFENYEQPSLLPFTSEKLDRNKGKGQFKKEQIYFDKEYTQKIIDLSQSFHVTPNTLMQGVWAILLSRYTNLSDVIFGATVSGRPTHLDYTNKVGIFINTLPTRCILSEGEDLKSFFTRMQRESVSLRNFQHTSINNIKEWNSIKEELFDSLWIFNNFPITEQSEKQEHILQIKSVSSEGNNNYLITILLTLKDTLSVEFTYNSSLIASAYIHQIKDHIRIVLDQLLSGTVSTLEEIDIVSENEKEILLTAFNNTTVAYQNNRTVLDVFNAQVSQTPDAAAVVFEDTSLTYKELDVKVNQLANYLITNENIAVNDFVGIHLTNSEWVAISVLAVLKTGAAYVPIDPKLPTSRIDFLKKESNSKVIIDDALLGAFKQEEWVDTKPDITIDPTSIAYVIYTSGSTGTPKGVMIEHQSLMNYLDWGLSFYLDNNLSNSNFGLFTTLSFDLTVTSFFIPLLSGGKLEIFSSDKEIAQVLTTYLEGDISCIKLTPAHINYLEELAITSTTLELAIVGGDTLHNNHIDILKKINPSIKIYNEYGPTESTVGAIVHEMTSSEEQVLIGTPIANTEVYILDSNLNVVPKGVLGEICIGGKGLAKGYFNQPTLTADKFIEHPFKEGERVYRTGDLAKWLPDGTIEFYGRKDNQVKIRGYRIELGEIEAQLQAREAIDAVHVLVNESENIEKSLIAYIISKQEQNVTELRNYLLGILPEYMVPDHFVQIESIPLTINGKVDKKALLTSGSEKISTGVEYVAPETEIEKKIVAIWEKILERDAIGVNDDFFKLGGHSLNVIRLANECRKAFNVKVGLKKIYKHTTVASQAILIEESVTSNFTSIPVLPSSTDYKVSDGQRRLWILSQFSDKSAAYNMPSRVLLQGTYDVASFSKAIDATIDRHEILRTVFKLNDEGEVRQKICSIEELNFTIEFEDYRSYEDKEERVQNYIKEDSYKLFDLENGPLLRASLLQVSDEEYIFYYNMHHIISDGWSIEVLKKDVFEFYNAFTNNEKPNLVDLKIQYKDYAAWQIDEAAKGNNAKHKEFWLNMLSGELPVLNLPSSKARPSVKTYNGHSLRTFISKEATIKAQDFIADHGGSLFTVLVSVWNTLLYRYTSEKDIIIGTPTAGRNHADLANQIGFYVNTLALRNQINPEECFTSFYKRVKELTLSAYENQTYPFDKLVDDLDIIQDASRNVIFDIILILQNTGSKIENVDISDEVVNTITDLGTTISKYDLDLNFKEYGDYISFNVSYNTDVYELEMVEQLMQHFKYLLNSLLVSPEVPLKTINYLTKSETEQLLYDFNTTKVLYPGDRTLVELFKEQVILRANKTAVVYEDSRLTYKELDELSNQFANYLKTECTIQYGDMVGIELDRSEWFLVCMFGILKLGAVYVPINPEFAKERINFIKEDANCVVSINTGTIETFKETASQYDITFEVENTKPDSDAYVMYTSGSTGIPKGVVIEQKSIVRLVKNTNYIEINENDNILSLSNFSFDGATFDIFMPLLNGGTLVISSKDIFLDFHQFDELIQSQKIDSFFLTTALFNTIVESKLSSLKNLKYVLFGGEQVSVKHAKKFKELYPNVNLHHVYGPTENTTFSTYYEIKNVEDDQRTIPVGTPIANSTTYILDINSELVPIGVSGEICLGGDGLAKGYLNQKELTEDRFVIHPCISGELIYRTGDIGKWLPTGDIEFIGRKDNQVKIRGHRIELGEIENALLKQKEIDDAVVLVRKNEGGEKELIAYIISSVDQNISTLRTQLKDSLSDYMLPSYYIQMEEFPLTSNGKVNKKELPDPEKFGLSGLAEYIEPRNETEKQLVEIWEKVLQKDKIGIRDNFFDLGGHSLKATRLLNEIHKTFEVQIKIRDMYNRANIEELAIEIDVASKIMGLQKESGRSKVMKI